MAAIQMCVYGGQASSSFEQGIEPQNTVLELKSCQQMKSYCTQIIEMFCTSQVIPHNCTD